MLTLELKIDNFGTYRQRFLKAANNSSVNQTRLLTTNNKFKATTTKNLNKDFMSFYLNQRELRLAMVD